MTKPGAIPIVDSVTRSSSKRLLIAICCVALAAGLFLIAWNNGLRQTFIPKKWGVVEAGKLYRSGQISQRLLGRTLTKNHIGLIIDLSVEDTPDARAERQTASQLGIPRLNFPLRGNGVGNPGMYTNAISAIIEANRKGTAVLVHCQAGTERTGGIVAVYRILVEGESKDQAFAEARSFGHDDRENPHLVPFVEEHLAQWKSELMQRHLING